MANTGDVNITDQSSRKKVDSYDASDIMELYKKAHPSNWQQLLEYVETQGDSTWHITPGEAVAIKNAVQQAIKHHARFSADPAEAFQILSKYGTEGAVPEGRGASPEEPRKH